MIEELIKEILGILKFFKLVIMEKSFNGEVIVTMVFLVSEIQLTVVTGGVEFFCYRCIIFFVVVVFIVGIVVIVVVYSFNFYGFIIFILGLVFLLLGFFLLVFSVLCWKVRQRSKKVKRRESQTVFVVNQRSLFVQD